MELRLISLMVIYVYMRFNCCLKSQKWVMETFNLVKIWMELRLASLVIIYKRFDVIQKHINGLKIYLVEVWMELKLIASLVVMYKRFDVVQKGINRLWKYLIQLRLSLNGIEIDQSGTDIYEI